MHAEQASSRCVLEGGGEGGGGTGLLSKGGGSNRLPGLVTKQQAVEFPQVLASLYNIVLEHSTVINDDYDHVHNQRVWAKLTPIQSINTIDTLRGP